MSSASMSAGWRTPQSLPLGDLGAGRVGGCRDSSPAALTSASGRGPRESQSFWGGHAGGAVVGVALEAWMQPMDIIASRGDVDHVRAEGEGDERVVGQSRACRSR